MSGKSQVPNRRSATISTARQQPRLFRSCKAATCTAPFASCRRREEQSGVAQSKILSMRFGSSPRRGVKEVTLLGQIVNLYGRHEFAKRDGPEPVCSIARGGLRRRRRRSRAFHLSTSDRLSRGSCSARFPIWKSLSSMFICRCKADQIAFLRVMRRGYTSETYLRLVRCLRQARPGIAITTDIIVGFPGETDEDYQSTRAMADRVGFDNAFVFRYSQRRDTPAAAMQDQVAEETKEFRNQDLLSVVNRHSKEKLNAHIGRRVEILCEGRSKNNPSRLTGRTRTNKIVVFEGSPRHIGEIFDVHIGSASASTLYGDPALIAS